MSLLKISKFTSILILARTTMVMTVLLTLTSMFGSLSDFTPRISYTTKLDNWILTCIVFVVIVLVELIIALYLGSKTSRNKLNIVSAFTLADKSAKQQRHNPSPNARCFSPWQNLSAETLDNITQVCFFFTLSIYNAYYWTDLLTS